VYVADYLNNVVRAVVYSSAFQCPVGYQCQCGTPLPCQDPAFFCPVGIAIPVPVPAGYASIASTDPITGMSLRTGQYECAAGVYCTGGTSFACPLGTYSSAVRAMSSGTCTQCPRGQVGTSFQAPTPTTCTTCPPGSTASPDGSLCLWRRANTDMTGGTCLAGAFSMPSLGRDCVGLPRTVYEVNRPFDEWQWVQPPNTHEATDDDKRAIAAILGCVGAVGVMAAIWFAFRGCTTPAGRTGAVSDFAPARTGKESSGPMDYMQAQLWKWANQLALNADQFSMQAGSSDNAPFVRRASLFGFSVTVLAFVAFLAIAAVQVVQYTSNNIITDSIMPLFIAQDGAVNSSLAAVPRNLADFLGPLQPAKPLEMFIIPSNPRCTTALNVSLGDPYAIAEYGTVAVNTLTAHRFNCTTCWIDAPVSVSLTLPPHCQQLSLIITAAGSSDSITVLHDITAGEPGGAGWLAGITWSFAALMRWKRDMTSTPAALAQRFSDERGVLVHTPSALAQFTNATPPNVTVTLAITPDLFVAKMELQRLASVAELTSNIVSWWSQVVGAFGVIVVVARCFMARSKAPSHAEAVAAALLPPTPILMVRSSKPSRGRRTTSRNGDVELTGMEGAKVEMRLRGFAKLEGESHPTMLVEPVVAGTPDAMDDDDGASVATGRGRSGTGVTASGLTSPRQRVALNVARPSIAAASTGFGGADDSIADVAFRTQTRPSVAPSAIPPIAIRMTSSSQAGGGGLEAATGSGTGVVARDSPLAKHLHVNVYSAPLSPTPAASPLPTPPVAAPTPPTSGRLMAAGGTASSLGGVVANPLLGLSRPLPAVVPMPASGPLRGLPRAASIPTSAGAAAAGAGGALAGSTPSAAAGAGGALAGSTPSAAADTSQGSGPLRVARSAGERTHGGGHLAQIA